ncbi:hypothetical protein EJB05_19082, partial [Eragrostis curvula]
MATTLLPVESPAKGLRGCRIDPLGVPSFHWICYSTVLIIYCEVSHPPVSI